ncbi:hypothetical protein RND81_05G108000 [Saponaria officinalis]|uniref:BZIP domain-containing protein n=1 Tax=Saponaria officinalis TaxID=3572 RepID=A0AAW1KW60_SAPOF
MATSSGTSSLQQISSSEGDIQMQTMDDKKRKRMQSNRESARRSRLRKQKHLDDLTAQVVNLTQVNAQILSNINTTTQQFLEIESQNSVLRVQMSELTHRLQSLNEINDAINNVNYNDDHNLGMNGGDEWFTIGQGHFGNPWNCVNQPIIASADMFQY